MHNNSSKIDSKLIEYLTNHDGTLPMHTLKHKDVENAYCNKTKGLIVTVGKSYEEVKVQEYDEEGYLVEYTFDGDSYRTIKVWNYKTGKCLHSLPRPKFWTGFVSFTKKVWVNGDLSLVATNRYQTVHVFHAQTAKLICALKHGYNVDNVLFNEDSSQIITESYDQIKAWDLSGEILAFTKLAKKEDFYNSIQFKPCSKTFEEVEHSGDVVQIKTLDTNYKKKDTLLNWLYKEMTGEQIKVVNKMYAEKSKNKETIKLEPKEKELFNLIPEDIRDILLAYFDVKIAKQKSGDDCIIL